MVSIPVKEGSIYLIEIEDLGDSGEGIGRVDGFTVFVDRGVPKDKVYVKIIKLKKNYAIGEIVDFIEKSPYRIKENCLIADKCGGCQIQHIDYDYQLALKRKKVKSVVERIGKLKDVKIHDVIGMNKPYRYRNKAQFPLGMKDGKAIIGFYKKGTHEVVDTDSCLIQHEVNDKVIKVFKRFINEKKIDIYDEKTGKGLLRHVLTRVSFATGDLMIVVITNGDNLPYKDEMIKEILKEIPQTKSIIQNINKRRTNVILGSKCITLYGEDKIMDYIEDLKFEISPLSFFQVNSIQTVKLYNKALEYANLTGNEVVFDIYCGIGTISLFLSRRAKKVYGIEVVESAIEDARRNAKLNNVKNVEFFVGKAEKVVPEIYNKGLKADVVVVDPPRKGCEKIVLETIANMAPKKIVYVSCKPSTLARDLKILDELGYKTLEIQPVDMFPHTAHVESVVLIKRKHSL
ncbi:23S rRNA m(5)U-1939 methyltransferase [Caminicella sporogenes DSM 14501]|uniref:23S rRNA m(5)U-1939 methyltransferase n=1 Tax=Caminicella sporogenes DSM 14501 TaxID=1121266 RepID=A0A1M6RHU5_9FIRM|nr:23S rRNA (uracil(1939)-C(5))-methyltransferase RlmD [Caminicella sporogenes]RKD25239.1 23S rRNA (uracil-5-)-methyltransferase RumA [Caminicella sporogenes]SHK31976.1 23S rRNA m(5)U-1939 methyltransferase [Caminicella sporogenes DSM 14501]